MSEAAAKADAKVMLIGMRMPPNYGRDYADKFFAMYGTLSKDIKAPLVPFMLDGVADKPRCSSRTACTHWPKRIRLFSPISGPPCRKPSRLNEVP
jgi:lysophospholipase L1-like esterase